MIEITTKRVILAIAGIAAGLGLQQGLSAADELGQAKNAAEKLVKAEEEMHEQWFSLSSARAASTGIADASREKAERDLAEFQKAQTDKGRGAQQTADTLQTETRGEQGDSLKALRSASDQMITDHEVALRAIEALPPMEARMWEMIAKTQAALRKVAELEARQAQEVADQAAAGPAKDSAAEKARLAWQKMREIDVLTEWKSEMWTRSFRQATARQMSQTSQAAGKLAAGLVAVENDPVRQERLKTLIAESADKENQAKQQVKALGEAADAAAERQRVLGNLAWGGLKPLDVSQWDRAKARHLLVRAGFGGTPKQVAELHAKGLHRAVDSLVDFQNQTAAGPGFDAAPPQASQPYEAMIRLDRLKARAANQRENLDNQQLTRLRNWWLKRMVESTRPLQEKLTLCWHRHFAVQQSVVGNSYALYRQNQLFREHAAGNFAALLYGIVHDPAMLRYLDNNSNVKGHANENLAREIMELFAMGEYQGYGETDVREAARALTGYDFDARSGQFRFRHDQHDGEPKTVFGQTGPYTGDDLVALILEQPSTSRFISTKLFESFAYQNPGDETVESLARVLRDAEYELAPVLKNLFLSEEFYSSKAIGTQVKSPVELVVGTLRNLGIKQLANPAPLDKALQEMGQELFEPPDVKGWRGGRSWINSSRLLVRYNTVTDLVRDVHQGGKQTGVDVMALLEGAQHETPSDIVNSLGQLCLARPLGESKHQELVACLDDLPPFPQWAKQHDQVNRRLQDVLVLLTSLPEYQFQ
jgi:uncharacterized protein (DUF1800 family)